jgi:gliding motility-associated-like protein
MNRYFRFLTLLLVSLFAFNEAHATHIRAGEITAKRISNTTLTYRVTLTTYTDEINGKAANDGQETVFFYFGLSSNQIESAEVRRKSRTQISASTVVNVYDTVFTYPAPGTYTISCGITNRNRNTINLPGATDAISFFVQTRIFINSAIGLNSTPVLLNIPVDSAAAGVRYIHNPGAFDTDGDSLAYRLTTPRRDKGDATGIGEFIEGYLSPETLGESPIQNERKTGPATFTINARTGDLIWDAPQRTGQYNVAFVVEEWRRGPNGDFLKIGEIVRDMQIIVVETNNKRPELAVPSDICVEAGEVINFVVTATDPDEGQKLKLTSSGGIYNVDFNGKPVDNIALEAASYTPLNVNQDSPAKVEFTWRTNCAHVQQQDYDVLFKVEDFPGRFETQLTDIKTVKIKVLPPRPKGLVAVEKDAGVALTWQPYPQCSEGGEIIIYRREGCSGQNAGGCTTGIPAGWGYTEIARVTTNDTLFLDANTVKGVTYSYRLSADINVNPFTNLMSPPSTEFCIGSELPERVPIITNVTVEETNADAGQIMVKWTRPIDLDTTEYAGPYRYDLYRATGLSGNDFTLIAQVNTELGTAEDTVFVDNNLDTERSVYRYKIEFNIEGGRLLGTTPPASSVRLLASPDDEAVRLRWEANVPWSNDNQRHRIYREISPGIYNAIAEVDVLGGNTFNYVDDGKDKIPDDGDQSITLENGNTYCYLVETVGQYEKVLELGLLVNYSQRACAVPADRSPPCPPNLTVAEIRCETITPEQYCDIAFFQNVLTWDNPEANGSGIQCRRDILRYNIYYARYEDESPSQIGSVDATLPREFRHQKDRQEGFAGCYYITSVSSVGIESTPSAKFCVDNCTNIAFPNIFSPNDDNVNDTFSPMKCPAFIKEISIVVYNRYGARVYDNTDTSLNWDGKNNAGEDLPSGTYFYQISVQFEQLSRTGETYTFKGWVELVR